LKAEYDWKDKTIGIIKERLGVEEEMTEMVRLKETKMTRMWMMAERQGTTSKR
jgi:hypothetical protein